MRGSNICASCFQTVQARPRSTAHLDHLASRAFYRQAPLQGLGRLGFSTSTPRQEEKALVKQLKASRVRSRNPILSITAAILVGAAWYALSGTSEDKSLNTTKFTPFVILAKEQVSPSAFVITIRCPDDVAIKNNAKVKAAWEHGLWSVEMKQPQLQIARHYTPLPPLAGEDGTNLRFLIRKMDSGEMSNYLFRLQVGEQVWLRGPHYGFDIIKRMGAAKNVVFLAGGTGVAPALQIAHKLLDGSKGDVGGVRPSIRILWANRKSVDSLGKEELSGTARRKTSAATVSDTFTDQIVELSRRHGDRFTIDYFVDDERRFISQKDIDEATGLQSKSQRQAVFAAIGKRCHWHSHDSLAATSDEDDKAATEVSCTCRAHNMPPEPIGRNLLCVSGPEGFVEVFAGSKRWFGGREIQGPVLGMLGSMKRIDPRMDDWLVLKM